MSRAFAKASRLRSKEPPKLGLAYECCATPGRAQPQKTRGITSYRSMAFTSGVATLLHLVALLTSIQAVSACCTDCSQQQAFPPPPHDYFLQHSGPVGKLGAHLKVQPLLSGPSQALNHVLPRALAWAPCWLLACPDSRVWSRESAVS